MKSLAGEFGCQSNDLQQYFFFLLWQQEKQPVRREWNDSFSQLSSFLSIIMVPEYAEGGLVGQTRITNGKNYPNSLYIGRRLKCFFENIQVVVIQKCCNENYLILIGRFLTKLCGRNKKWSSSNYAKVQSFGWPIQYSTTFESNTVPKLRKVDFVGIPNFINEILQVFHFCWLVFVHHRAFSRH